MDHQGRSHAATLSPYAAASSITALTAGAATITLDLSNAPPRAAHWYAAIEYYSDANGTPATPGAGTATVTVKTGLLPNQFQALEWNEHSAGGGVVNGASNIQLDWESGAVLSVKAVMAGITTATHCRLRVLGVGA